MRYIVLISCLATAFFSFSNSTSAQHISRSFHSSFLPAKLHSDSHTGRTTVFKNPAVKPFDNRCLPENLSVTRFSDELSASDRVGFCRAMAQISERLNNTNWSPHVRAELEQIWDVFTTENVTIRPMKNGISSRVAASAEAYVPNSPDKGFRASLYLRPNSSKDNSFFMVTIHELRHIYDFHRVWKTRAGLTKAELEKRGFRIMGKIAKETPQKESFSRLPRLWKEKWRDLSDAEFAEKMERNIVKYMRKSKFYRHLIREPDKEYIGFRSGTGGKSNSQLALTDHGKGARLPYLVRTRQLATEIKQNVKEVSFTVQKARDSKNPIELLDTAIKNEQALYHKMDNFVYDQDLELKCWKKDRITESYLRTRQVARIQKGKPLFENELITHRSKKKPGAPSCLLDMDSISTDTTETFWSAPYLDEMPIKFDYYTELDGVRVARYTVYKPSAQKFNQMAAKYPFINPFRVFFGTIFVSVADSQIIKFWGSSFPESRTTGMSSGGTHASYNATAVRGKLASGLWVTTMLNTVAVAKKEGKMMPFSYIVKYKNYRQGTSDVIILDDDESFAGTGPEAPRRVGF